MTERALTPAQQKASQAKRSLRTLLEQGAREFAAVLPKHLTPERLIRVAMTACTAQPKLLECSQESVALALLSASQCGLEPDGYHAHLVPYGRQCQFIPDFKGLIQLALENDVVIDAFPVYENDDFSYQLGTQPMIHHRPCEGDRGGLRCAYAVAHFGRGFVKFMVATKDDIAKRRDSSKATGPDSPWKKWEAEMWVKTAIKMLAKYIPRSQRMRAALLHDDTAEMGMQQRPDIVDAVASRNIPNQPSKTDSTADGFAARLAAPDYDSDETTELTGGFYLPEFEQLMGQVTTAEEAAALFESMVESQKKGIRADEYAKALALATERRKELAAAY